MSDNRGNARGRAELATEGALREQAREARREALRRWFERNPGEPVSLAAEACGAPLGMAKDVAQSIGHRRVRYVMRPQRRAS